MKTIPPNQGTCHPGPKCEINQMALPMKLSNMVLPERQVFLSTGKNSEDPGIDIGKTHKISHLLMLEQSHTERILEEF
jgi:hypothetical protein